MNTGQMLITVGAMMLLGMIILRVNNGFLTTGTVLMESKFGVLGVSLATSVIEEANSKAFDEETDTMSVNNVNMITAPNNLGPESGESYETFDDFDDYNGYSRIDSTMPSAVFHLDSKVEYVKDNEPDKVITNKATWHKRITVTVTSPSMQDTVTMSSVFSYWFFR